MTMDEGRSGDEDAPSTRPTVAPGTPLSTTDAVYLVFLAPECFEKAYLSPEGTQLKLRCGSGDPSGILSRERDHLVSLFTRFWNCQCRARRKVNGAKPEGGHAAEDLWVRFVTSPKKITGFFRLLYQKYPIQCNYCI